MKSAIVPLSALTMLVAISYLLPAQQMRPVSTSGTRSFRHYGDVFCFIQEDKPPKVPTKPTERKALAEKLVARIESLNQTEMEQLVQLDAEAYAALYARAKKIQSDPKQSNEGDKSLGAVDTFSRVCRMLAAVMHPEHTSEIVALYHMAEKNKSASARAALLGVLGSRADPNQSVPIFLQVLTTEKPEWDYRYSPTYIALALITRSEHPLAVKYLIDKLNDPKADDNIRHEAYVNLARIGGADGLKAVRAHRAEPMQLPSLSEYMHLDTLGIKPDPMGRGRAVLMDTHKDQQGTLWGLLRCTALGSTGDLWIVHHDGKHWVEPLFSGVDGSTRNFRRKAATTLMDLPREKFLAGGWFDKLVGNPELSRDTDGDGWTDLVEKQLGTDPTKSDTDGDGIPDSKDANPLTGRKPQTDEEKILAAAFEGRFRYAEDDVPCVVVMPEGIEPVEMLGWGWIVLAVKKESDTPVADLYGEGVCMIHFSLPSYGFNEPQVQLPPKNAAILWNRDHTEAAVGMSVYYGGLDGTVYDLRLKKFGNEWIVVAAFMTAIS
ncbi:MAG TPA: hypothetical protein VKU00_15985 [Chthonomonadaceae bacterium]|nr:hypothetical protein [Chthonomonadaceae bacterium]